MLSLAGCRSPVPVLQWNVLLSEAILTSVPAFQQSRRYINTGQPQAWTTLTLMIFNAWYYSFETDMVGGSHASQQMTQWFELWRKSSCILNSGTFPRITWFIQALHNEIVRSSLVFRSTKLPTNHAQGLGIQHKQNGTFSFVHPELGWDIYLSVVLLTFSPYKSKIREIETYLKFRYASHIIVQLQRLCLMVL